MSTPYNNTIALLGAASTTGGLLAKGICGQYPLILVDTDAQAVSALQGRLQQLQPGAAVDLLACCKNASWEADTIVLAVDAHEQCPMAEAIWELATRKTVIVVNLSPQNRVSFYDRLNHAVIVTADIQNQNVLLNGENAEAITLAAQLMQLSGFRIPSVPCTQ